MNWLKTTTKVYEKVVYGLAVAGMACLAFTMLSVSWGVVARYFIHKPVPWLVEINEYLLLYMTFLAVAWIMKNDGHVRIDIVVLRLGKRAGDILNAITYGASVLICAVLVWYGSYVTVEFFRMGRYEQTYLNIPLAFTLGVIPIGSFFLLIETLRKTYGFIRGTGVAK